MKKNSYKRSPLCFFVMLISCVLTTFAQVPTFTSFNPMSGKPENNVTLTGTNFSTTDTNNIVFFGAIRATLTAVSATSVTFTVP